MLTLYWQLGDAIRTRQEAAGWGGKVIDRFAADLRAEFPDMKIPKKLWINQPQPELPAT